MSKEIECPDCGAVFVVDIIEEGDETDTPKFCPFCGSENVDDSDDYEDEDGIDDNELFNDDDD